MDNAIEVYNLTKYYGDLLAVDHINFEVRQGEVFGFLGPNGAGKTTTQRMLTTLLEPTEGRIVIHGRDLARDPYPVKRQMGLLPEEATVYTELTAWENLMFTATLYRVPRSERSARAREGGMPSSSCSAGSRARGSSCSRTHPWPRRRPCSRPSSGERRPSCGPEGSPPSWAALTAPSSPSAWAPCSSCSPTASRPRFGARNSDART